jgi:hypothetical protein
MHILLFTSSVYCHLPLNFIAYRIVCLIFLLEMLQIVISNNGLYPEDVLKHNKKALFKNFVQNDQLFRLF